MNEEDFRMRSGEREASPVRFPGSSERYEEVERIEPPLSRHATADTTSSVSTHRVGTHPGISRLPTQRDDEGYLARHPTSLSRIATGRSQHSHTLASSTRSRTLRRHETTPMPNFGGGKPFPPALPDREEYVVEFDGPDDPLHAQNWPFTKKLGVSAILGFVTLTAAFGSSIFSSALTGVEAEFGISREVGTLGVSLYVLGFATGPILWAPLSELYGRRLPLTGASFLFSIFMIGVAVAKDAQTLFICRFFGGFFGACPLTNVGACFSDLYSNAQRGIAITIFSICVFSGPLLAVPIGAFISDSYLGWRWTQYITAIMGFTGLVLEILFLQETYPPVILVNKAADLRRRTKNWGIHARQEEIEIDLRELLEKNISRPLRMLFTEPIILLISIYMAFVYGLLYLFLTFYPIVFQGLYGFNPGVAGLTFLGMIVGELIAGTYILITQPSYQRKLKANNNMPIPEWRLPPAIAGGISFAIGLFWFAWSGYQGPKVHWIVPTLSGLCTGFGIMCIFLQCLNYLIDAYLMFAASAIAANTFLRSLAGAGFPLFAYQMVTGMGVQWAGTLLGCVAAVMIPVPVYFYLRGHQLRQKSKFAPTFSTANKDDHAEVSSEEGGEGGPGNGEPYEK